jgi:hypothetical protein
MNLTQQQKAFMNATKEYQENVISTAEALNTLKQSGFIKGFKIIVTENSEQFVSDVQMVLNTVEEQDKENTEKNIECNNCEDGSSYDDLAEMILELVSATESLAEATYHRFKKMEQNQILLAKALLQNGGSN